MYTFGSIHPDEEAGSVNGEDKLPCMLELQHVIKKAHAFVLEHDTTYKDILALPTVQASARPPVTAFAIYVQHLMSQSLDLIGTQVKHTKLRILAYVMDGIYVIADSQNELETTFGMIAQRVYQDHGLKVTLKSAAGVKLHTY